MKFRYILLSIFLVVLILRFFVVDICKVSGGSMASTLYPNDWLVFVRRGLFFYAPKRLDIHIIKSNPRNLFEFDGFLIKRLVGMPGELISIDDSVVKINGGILVNPNSVRFNYTIPDKVISYEDLLKIIPSNVSVNYSKSTSMFILNLSGHDRRKLNKISEIALKYLAIAEDQTSPTYSDPKVYYYGDSSLYQKDSSKSNFRVFHNNFNQKAGTKNGIRFLNDQYYYLGDNRPCSTDSRSFGSIPWDRIKGKALFILFRIKNGRIEMFKSLAQNVQ